MNPLFFLSQRDFFYHNNNQVTPISFEAIELYKKNLQQIKQRKEWKNKGTGAQFMGFANVDAPEQKSIYLSDVVKQDADHIIYAARLDDGMALYSKSLTNSDETEGLILRTDDFVVYDMDYDAQNKRLVMSASHACSLEKHLKILAVDGNQAQYVTEGDCQDANPVFDHANPDVIYYDTRGIGHNARGEVFFGPKEICQLNIKTGDLDTVIGNADYNYYKPQKDGQGNLYFLKTPYKNKVQSDPLGMFKAILMAPFKIMNAIVSWLDFFTQRYTGESIKTAGNNPAKSQQKTLEEMFIEDNLIEAQKSLQQNQKAGEKYPGLIPRSWELVMMTPTGDMQTLKKGVLSYSLTHDGIIYSNGKHVVHLDAQKNETQLSEEKLITKIRG